MPEILKLDGVPIPPDTCFDLQFKWSYDRPQNMARALTSKPIYQTTAYVPQLRIEISGSGWATSVVSALRPGDLTLIDFPIPVLTRENNSDQVWSSARQVSMLTDTEVAFNRYYLVEVRDGRSLFDFEWRFMYPDGSAPDVQWSYYAFWPSVQCVVSSVDISGGFASRSFSATFLAIDATQYLTEDYIAGEGLNDYL